MVFTIISCSLDTTPKKLSNESKTLVKTNSLISTPVKRNNERKVTFKSEPLKKTNKTFSTKATGSLFSGGVISTFPNSGSIIIDIDAEDGEEWSLDFSTIDICGYQIIAEPYLGVGATRLTMGIGGVWPDGTYTVSLNGSAIGFFDIKNEQGITITKQSENETSITFLVESTTNEPYAYEVVGIRKIECVLTNMTLIARKSDFTPGTYELKAYIMKYPDISASAGFTIEPPATPTPTATPTAIDISVSPSSPTPTPSATATPTATPTPTPSPTPTVLLDDGQSCTSDSQCKSNSCKPVDIGGQGSVCKGTPDPEPTIVVPPSSSPTPSSNPSTNPSATPTPTANPTPTPVPTPTHTPVPTPTATPVPTPTPSVFGEGESCGNEEWVITE